MARRLLSRVQAASGAGDAPDGTLSFVGGPYVYMYANELHTLICT